MTGMVRDMKPDAARMKTAAGDGYATATDLADWLVRTLKMPFREAHHITGRIVAKAAADGVPLHKLPLADMQAIEPTNHRGRVRRAVGRPLGAEPRQLWRHRAEERQGAGQALAQETGPSSAVRSQEPKMGRLKGGANTEAEAEKLSLAQLEILISGPNGV